MSTSSDSDEYSFRVLRETNKENDENFTSCKKNFIQDIQNGSHILVNGSLKRKEEHLDEFENYLNSSQTNKKKKVHHSNEGDVVDNEYDDFVTDRVNHKKNRMLADGDQLEVSSHELKSEGRKKNKMQSFPGELNLLEVESVGNKQEQTVSRKQQKKSQIEVKEFIKAAKLHLQMSNKKSKKPTKTVKDPAHILKTFEKNNLSLKKVNFGRDNLPKIKQNRPCFILKVPVDLDPNQLIGQDISLHEKKRIQVGAREYSTTPRESEANLVVFGENQHLRLEVSRVVTMKTKGKDLSTRENKVLDDLIVEQVSSVSSINKKQEKFLTKDTKNNADQLDRFLKDGAKVLEDMKLFSFKFKNEKLMVDLEKQTNLVLQKQVEFLQEENTFTAEYKKTKKELEKQIRELLHKRVNIMKTKKGKSNENCNI